MVRFDVGINRKYFFATRVRCSWRGGLQGVAKGAQDTLNSSPYIDGLVSSPAFPAIRQYQLLKVFV